MANWLFPSFFFFACLFMFVYWNISCGKYLLCDFTMGLRSVFLVLSHQHLQFIFIVWSLFAQQKQKERKRRVNINISFDDLQPLFFRCFIFKLQPFLMSPNVFVTIFFSSTTSLLGRNVAYFPSISIIFDEEVV